METSLPVSEMASSLIGSEVLKIAGEIAALKRGGAQILNFTVGDFDPKFFPVPEILKTSLLKNLQNNETNYPPSSGVLELREAVAEFYSREFQIPVKTEEVIIAGGARPLIYTIFTAFLNENDTVLYPVPSWNNNHYTHLTRAKGIAIDCRPENGFLPTAADLAPHLGEATLLCLNSPLNPTGTVFKKTQLQEICTLVLEENKKRAAHGSRPLYMMYDQIYWKLTHSPAQHFHPLQVCPELKPWVIFVDGISKYFCATGLRVGWTVLPQSLMGTFSSILGHIGAWAPKPEQMATAELLRNRLAIEEFTQVTSRNIEKRLLPLFEGIQKLKAQGLLVDAVRPQGGIYLSVKIGLPPSKGGQSDDATRKALLEQTGIAVVPFQAFGLKQESSWFRLSIGAVSEADCVDFLTRLEKFLRVQKA